MPLLTHENHYELVKDRLEQGLSLRSLAYVLGVNKDTLRQFVRREELEDIVATLPKEDEYKPEFKILTIDIETKPNLVYAWDVWDQNIQPAMIVEPKSVISFAAKWYGEADVRFHSVDKDGYEYMVRSAWQLLNAADVVIGYNSKRFDVPHLNSEFLRLGLEPPAPFRQIDLLQTMRRQFKFTHNKLDHIATTLNIGSKTEHEGFALWKKCMAGDKDAWSRMEEYNRNDVILTEELYDEIKPWIQNHPSHAAIFGDTRCLTCGSVDLKRSGWAYTKTGRYQRYQCKHCKSYLRDTHVTARAPITSTSAW